MVSDNKNLMGEFIGMYLARSKSEEIRKKRVASGGAVTSILVYMLETGVVDGIVAAKRLKGFEGEVVVAKTRKELIEAAGNRWSIVPFASRIRAKIEEEDLDSVAVVCLPCQAQFFGQMRDFPLLETDFGGKIKYIISLFCVGTFAFEPFLSYLRMKYGLMAENIKDIVLKGEVLEVLHSGGVLELSIKDVYTYLQTGCLVCSDYTGTWSDISAGSVESERGWTILLTRNPKAEDLVKSAEKEGYIELYNGSHVESEIVRDSKEKVARAQRNMMYLL